VTVFTSGTFALALSDPNVDVDPDLELHARAELFDTWCVCDDCLPDPTVRAAARRVALRDAVVVLDARGPVAWRGRVSVARLDMLSAADCLLGQLYGDYGVGLRALYGDDLGELYGHREDAVESLAFTSTVPRDLWRPVLAGYAP
jgi:hypothetical protein